MNYFKKIINPGCKGRQIIITITFENNVLTLSGQNGQMQKEILKKENIKISNNWNIDMIKKLCDIWDMYHFNDICKGTQEQIDFINKWEKYNVYTFNEKCELFKKNNLFEINGYKYGTMRFIEVPIKILDWLINLPNATIKGEERLTISNVKPMFSNTKNVILYKHLNNELFYLSNFEKNIYDENLVKINLTTNLKEAIYYPKLSEQVDYICNKYGFREKEYKNFVINLGEYYVSEFEETNLKIELTKSIINAKKFNNIEKIENIVKEIGGIIQQIQ